MHNAHQAQLDLRLIESIKLKNPTEFESWKKPVDLLLVFNLAQFADITVYIALSIQFISLTFNIQYMSYKTDRFLIFGSSRAKTSTASISTMIALFTAI